MTVIKKNLQIIVMDGNNVFYHESLREFIIINLMTVKSIIQARVSEVKVNLIRSEFQPKCEHKNTTFSVSDRITTAFDNQTLTVKRTRAESV